LKYILVVEVGVEVASGSVEAVVLTFSLRLNVGDGVDGVLFVEIAAVCGAAGATGGAGDAVHTFFFSGDGVEHDAELWQVLIEFAVVGEAFTLGGGTGLLAHIDVVHVGHYVLDIIGVPCTPIGEAGRNISKG